MTEKKSQILLIVATAIWGSSYLFMKVGLNDFAPFNLLALRFGLAFLALLPAFYCYRRQINRRLFLYGLIQGLLLFLVFATMLFGLKTTSTTNAAFLASATVVMVPLLDSLLQRRLPRLQVIAGVFLSVAGIGCLTLDGAMTVAPGDLLCLLSAFFYALQIMTTNHTVKKADPVLLGALQMGVAALLGLAFSLMTESPILPQSSGTWGSILVLALLCSAFGFVMQTVAQKYTSPLRTTMIFSLEPLFSVILGLIVLDEVMTPAGLTGAFLLLAGIYTADIWRPSQFKVFFTKAANKIQPAKRLHTKQETA